MPSSEAKRHIPLWVRYLGLATIIIILSSPFAWCVMQVGGGGTEAVQVPVAVPKSPALSRQDALLKVRAIYPVTAGVKVSATTPKADEFSCDAVSVDGVIIRACGYGPEALDSLTITAPYHGKGAMTGAMARATKAILLVMDPEVRPDDLFRVQNEVQKIAQAAGQDVRSCTPGACIYVSANRELWALTSSVPSS
ncbi:MAG: hypothetical protein Q8L66_00630 [Caulobacter sp.]|nr:hypothetical protein [Caulobacter sp.]